MQTEDSFVDQILTSLRIISLIKENQKVCVRDGFIILESKSTGLMPAVRRWLNRDNRTKTIFYIQNVINHALEITKTHTDLETIEKLKQGIKNSVIGLKSLGVTYNNDAATFARITVLEERILSNINDSSFVSRTNGQAGHLQHKKN